MKQKDNSIWMNLVRTALMVVVMLVVLVKITGNNTKQEEKPKEEQETKEVKEFRNSELILWDTFLKEAKAKKLIHEDNLETIELYSVEDYGKYLKKKPNIRYQQVSYTFTCKDKTEDCVDNKLKITENKKVYTVLVQINLKDKNKIEFLNGCSFSINDELVNVDKPFVYDGEED